MIRWSHSDDPTICEFGNSGAQAQIAASQVASEQQRQAFEQALAFQKEQYGEMKENRRPYMNAGKDAVALAHSLLGLDPILGGSFGGGSGSGGGLGGSVGGSGASLGSLGRSTGASSSTGTSTGTSGRSSANAGDTGPIGFNDATGEKVPPPTTTYDPSFQKPTVDPNGAFFEPPFPYFDHTGNTDVPGADPKFASLLGVSSGAGDKTQAIPMRDPDGVEQWVPASLASAYQRRGFSFGE